MLTVTTAFNSDTGLLQVTSNSSDSISIASQSVSQRVTVNGKVVMNGLHSVLASEVTRLEVFGSERNNRIDLSQVTTTTFVGLAGANVPVSIAAGGGNDTIIGSAFGDRIDGGIGNDRIEGRGGNDSLIGQIGRDTIYGDAGSDTLDGGGDNDSLRGGTENDLLLGGSGNDALRGEAGDDVADGSIGNDSISGGTGHDTLHGGDGNDALAGEDGNDSLLGGAGNDSIRGDAGQDFADGSAGNDRIRGGTGHDTLSGGDDKDTLAGEDGNDSLLGGSGNDSIRGDAGDDFVNGAAGNDCIKGGTGHDSLRGGDDQDNLFGEDGNDSLNGERGNDTLSGGNHNDGLAGGEGNDSAVGGSGNDTVLGGIGNDRLKGDSGFDLVLGEDGNDTIDGGSNRPDTLAGGPGNDSIRSEAGEINESATFTATWVTGDLVPPVVTLNLESDTGASNSDKLTSNATIVGLVSEPLSELRARLDDALNSTALNLATVVQSDNTLRIDAALLTALAGGTLADGSHVLKLIASDTSGNVANEVLFAFTLDTTPPSVGISAQGTLAEPIDSITVTFSETMSASAFEVGSYRLEDENGDAIPLASVTPLGVENKQAFLQLATPLIDGGYVLELQPGIQDLAGHTPSGTGRFEFTIAAGDSSGFQLVEQTRFATEATVPVELGEVEGQRTLSFTVDHFFDRADQTSAVSDRLLVSLIDSTDPSRTLLDRGQLGTTLFSLSESDVEFIPGLVRFDGRTVEIDVSSVAESSGTLLFQLIGSDADSGSRVRIGNVLNIVNSDGIPNAVMSMSSSSVSPGVELDVSTFAATTDLRTEVENVRFDADSGEYSFDVRVRNQGAATGRQVVIAFPNLPGSVSLTNASGLTSNGTPYINLVDAIPNGGLGIRALSNEVTVTFSNSNAVQLPLVPTVLVGLPNRAPSFAVVPPQSVMPGDTLVIPLNATDPDGDRVTFAISATGSLPTGMLRGDGQLEFHPELDQLGTYTFDVIASDGVLTSRQSITLDVIADPNTTTRISGVVRSTLDQPLAGVPVEIAGFSTVTAADGSFTITLPTMKLPTEAFNIDIPAGDVFLDPFNTGTQQIRFRRARHDVTTGDDVGDPRQHPNLVTSFIDASMVYGSDDARAAALRTFSDGKLKTSDGNLLPLNNAATFPDGPLENDNEGRVNPATLFVAGDVRTNENVPLIAMHTVFVREHNRLAEEIKAADPSLTDEQIYQQARRTVAAIIQHVTYSEYLPLMLGEATLSPYLGYNSNVDPRESTLFAAAAFRLGHTQLASEIKRLDADGESLPGGSLTLQNAFFTPQPIQNDGIEPFLRGLAATTSQEVDAHVIDDVRNFLFGPPGSGGMDLASMNIQRGRDVGLPSYNQARIDFGLPAVSTFDEISSDPETAEALASVYSSVDDIDVWVGGIAEDHVPGTLIGPLLQAVLADQFERSRDGDRFWYENGQFTSTELAAIRSTTLEALVERNAPGVDLPANPFGGSTPTGPAPAGSVATTTATEFRSITGEGNNVANPNLGATGSHVLRNFTNGYEDGISDPAGSDRPNPREISNAVNAQSGSIPSTAGASAFLIFWGQILDHDLGLTPGGVGDTLKILGNQRPNPNGDEPYPFVAERMELMLGHEVYPGVNNVIDRPIYLPLIDVGNTVSIDPSQDVLVTTDQIPNATVFVESGTLANRSGGMFTGELSITEVPRGVTPAVLPDGFFPDIVVTIQPADMVFTTPAPITFPNRSGLLPGTLLDLWSINPITGAFDDVGDMRVSDDGQRIETISGGIRNSSWHFPQGQPTQPNDNDENEDNGCEECKANANANSEVLLHSGALIENHQLVTYQSLGQTRGVELVYDSQRADPRPIVHFRFDSVSGIRSDTLLVARMLVNDGNVSTFVPGRPSDDLGLGDNEHFWTIPSGASSLIASLQADLRHVDTTRINYGIAAGFFQPTGDGRLSGGRSTFAGDTLHVNEINSPFGAGWGISGLQKLVIDSDGSAIFVDGNGSESFFEAVSLPSSGPSANPGGGGGSGGGGSSDGDTGPIQIDDRIVDYTSPPGDFSVLHRAPGAPDVWTRIYPDGSVDRFEGNIQDRLARIVSRTDRVGNVTQYRYDAQGLLTKIIDPVGLETSFAYSDGQISTITDPAGRVTRFQFDADGNLTQITDPDQTSRRFQYDHQHHLTGEIDKRGFQENAVYDFAGRVTQATRKDGSVVQFSPLQTQKLHPAEATMNFASPPSAFIPTAPVATHTDANGNVIQTRLDRAGQAVTTNDSIGRLGTVSRNNNNRIEQSVDGLGNTSAYTYDANGNVTSIADDISSFFPSENSAVWVGGDGDWHDPANWSNGVVPGPGDDVTINVANDSISVTISSGTVVVGSLLSSEFLTIANARLVVTKTSRLSGGLIATTGASLEAIGDSTILTVSGPTQIDGASIRSGGGAIIRLISAQSFQDGTMTIDGPGTILSPLLTFVDETRFFLSGGATYTLPATTYRKSTQREGAIIRAEGVGTRLDLSALQSLETPGSFAFSIHSFRIAIEAFGGGVIDLSGLTSLVGRDGSDSLLINMDDASSIDLTNVTTITGHVSFLSEFGELNLPELVSAQILDLHVPQNGIALLPMLTTVSNPTFTIVGGGRLEAPSLAEFENGTLTLAGMNAQFLTAPLQAIDESRFFLNGGATYALPATTYRKATQRDGTIIRVDGPGTRLDLSALQSLETPGSFAFSIHSFRIAIEAFGGGVIDLSGLTSLVGRDGNDSLLINMDDASSVDLASVSTIGGHVTFSSSSGVLNLPALVSADIIDFVVPASGTTNLPLLSTVNLPRFIIGTDGLINAPNLSTFANGALTLAANAAVNLSTGDASVTNSRIVAGPGTTITAGSLRLLTGTVLETEGSQPNVAIFGNVVNSGRIRPGIEGAGHLAIHGNYTQTATGILEVGVLSATQFDQIEVSGNASLDGSLIGSGPSAVNVMNDDELPIITAASVSGTFAGNPEFALDPNAARILVPSYQPTSVILTPVVVANGHYYALTSQPLSWTDAEAEAVSLGGHLVSVNDRHEQRFLERVFSGNYWLGFNDVDVEGNFVWSTGEPVTFTNWGGGEPNNDGNVEDYAQILPNGFWNDGRNSHLVFGVMEFDTPPANFGGTLYHWSAPAVGMSLSNGDAESGPGATNNSDVVVISEWTVTGNTTAVEYGATGGFPSAGSPGPLSRGSNFFAGGPATAHSQATQIIDLTSLISEIDAGSVGFDLAGFLGGFENQEDAATMSARFLDTTGTSMLVTTIGPVTAADRGNQTGLLYRSASGTVPENTRSVEITVEFTRAFGEYNDGYADNIEFALTVDSSGLRAASLLAESNASTESDSEDGGDTQEQAPASAALFAQSTFDPATATVLERANIEPQPRRFTYDPFFNQLTSVTDELGRYTFYEIDPDNGNRLAEIRVQYENASYPGTAIERLTGDPVDVLATDVDSDGQVDLLAAVATPDGGQVLARFVFPDSGISHTFPLIETAPISSMRTVDLDGDSDDDLVLVHSTTISTWRHDEGLAFSLIETLDLGTEVIDVAVGEFNAFDRKDLAVIREGEENVRVFHNSGNGTFEGSDYFGHDLGKVRRLAVGDLDDDGDDDLIVGSEAVFGRTTRGVLNLFEQDGILRQQQHRPRTTNPAALVIRDSTIVVAGTSTTRFDGIDPIDRHQIDFFFTGLSGSSSDLEPDTTIAVENRPIDLVFSDIDGRLGDDLVLLTGDADSSETQAEVRFNRGNETFSKPQEFSTPGGATAFAVRDLDRDGLIDLAAVGTTADSLQTRTNLSGRITPDADDIVTRFTYTARGQLDTQSDPLGRITDYDYDQFGRVTKITFAKGTADEAAQRFEYDSAGNQTAFIDENGHRTEFEYDALNRLTRVIQADPDGPTNSQQSPVVEFAYDAAGNLTQTHDALGHPTTNQYDAFGRLIRVVDALGNVTRYQYDYQGNLVTIIDPLGHKTRNEYDARDRLVRTIDPIGAVTSFTYDLNGNTVSVTDPVGNVTRFFYDARDRLIREIDPLGNATTYDYDAVDNLIRKTDRLGRVTEYFHDDLDRPVLEQWIASNGAIVNEVHYDYDSASNLLATGDAFSDLGFTYDARNRVETATASGGPDSPHSVLTYGYDEVGNVTSVSDVIDGNPGATTAYVYDALNRLTKLTQSGVNVADKRVDFSYNANGQYETIRRFSNLAGTQHVATSTYQYDALNRLTSLTHRNNTEDVAFFRYTFDAASRITQITEIDGTITYGYDDRNQLTSADYSDPSRVDEFYRYDLNGNRVESHLHGTGYVTGPGNRLLSDGTYNYEYDAEGNTIRRTRITGTEPDGSTLREFAWDHRNRLHVVVDSDPLELTTQAVEFNYDTTNRRTNSILDHSPETTMRTIFMHFVYDREDVLIDLTLDSIGSFDELRVANRYLHGPDIDQVMAQGNAAAEWLLTDHLGSLRAITDPTGEVISRFDYGGFGEKRILVPAVFTSRYAFTGREHDVATGLNFHRARYYGTAQGILGCPRFLYQEL